LIGRRTALKLAALAPLASAVEGCAAFNVAEASNDVALIAGDLGLLIAQLPALKIPGLTPELIADVQKSVDAIKLIAQSLAGTVTTAAAQPLVRQIITYVGAVAEALATFALPQPLPAILAEVIALLPAILSAVDIFTPQASPAFRTFASSMTPDQARRLIRARLGK
jgi:hypothetical protein